MAENTVIRRHLLTADTGTRTITSVQAHEIHFAPGQIDDHSDTEPMVFVAFYLLNGEQKLIGMLDV